MPKQDLWHVKIAQAVVEMTLDELVDAYQAGRIEASTPVVAPGDQRWTTLGAVADLDDAADAERSEPCPPSIAPMATDIEMIGLDVMGFAEEPTLPAKKTRRVGRVTGVVFAYALLIAVGAGAGAYRAAPNEVHARISSIQAKLSRKGASESPRAAAAAATAAAAPPTPVAVLPPPAATPLVAAAPVPVSPPAAPSQVGTSIDNLPTAKPPVAKPPAIKASPRRTQRH